MGIDVTNNPLIVEMGLVIAIALVLSQALGPIISRMIEGIKPTGLIPDNWSGVFAILFGAWLGCVFGILGMISAEDTDNSWRFVIYGFVAGMIGPGAGAVQSAQTRTGIVVGKMVREDQAAAKELATVKQEETLKATSDSSLGEVAADDESPNGITYNAWWKEKVERETAEYEETFGKAAKAEEDPVIYEDPDKGAVTKSMLIE